MPDIGNPNVSRPNSFDKIKMRRSFDKHIERNTQGGNIGKELNEMAGIDYGPKARFVDKKTHNNLGKDGFLKLLSHQLANQDPLSPMDQKRFAADLAQFSQLEQLTNLNTKADKAEKNAPTQNKFYGASFIGKKIVTGGTTVDFQGEKSVILPFYLDKNAQSSILRIYDSSNSLIRQMNLGPLLKGSQAVEWDGIAEDGAQAAKGIYRFEINGYDNQYNRFKGETQTEGMVTGVNFENGETILTINGGKKVFLRDVKQFKIPDKKSSPQNDASLRKATQKVYNKVEG